jgi:hypothetical protein
LRGGAFEGAPGLRLDEQGDDLRMSLADAAFQRLHAPFDLGCVQLVLELEANAATI